VAQPKGRSRAARVLFLRRGEGAVSGVVAASLGVVLISVLLGMVVTFWVPAWGYDSEVAHAREVVNSFSQFKNAVELQTLQGNSNQLLTTSFSLGVGGVPLFGAETPGQLSYQYLEGGRVRFRANLTDLTGDVNFSATGSLFYQMQNRYFVPQKMSYETGALIVAQGDGQTVRLTPPFRFENGTGGLDVYLTLFTLDGTNGIVSGVDSHTVSSRLSLSQTFNYTWPGLNTIYLNVSSFFVDAWAHYFPDAMNGSSINATLYNVSKYPSTVPNTTTLRLSGVRTLAVTLALVQIRVD
jgi:hypothetical protein